jgi:hypothetical protein
MRRIRHDHRWSDLAFVNAVRAVLRLEPINGYDVDEVSYADAWPASDGCRQRRARIDGCHR